MSRKRKDHRASKAVGKVIRHYRDKANMTQAQVCQSMGVWQCSMSFWENGQCSPSYETLAMLAGVLKVSAAELFGAIGQEIGEIKQKRA